VSLGEAWDWYSQHFGIFENFLACWPESPNTDSQRISQLFATTLTWNWLRQEDQDSQCFDSCRDCLDKLRSDLGLGLDREYSLHIHDLFKNCTYIELKPRYLPCRASNKEGPCQFGRAAGGRDLSSLTKIEKIFF
jgi:hypothetical protein